MATKVTVVGAGAVGATCANVLAARGIASEVVLVDIKDGLSEGKMLDMFQAAATCGYKTKLTGVTATDAEGYKPTAGSDVVVITSGIPRKPGMTREELIGINANIVKSVVTNASKWSPKAIFVIISNPMDTMTYLTLKATGLPKNRVIGMGGALDSSRFRCYLSKASGVGIQDIDGMVIGGHGDTTMIPLVSKASIKGVPASQFLSKKKLEQVAADTMVGGATLTKDVLCKTYYDIVCKYFGPDVVCDKEIANEWMRIPHFYTNFYVYKYATCISAASSIAHRIETEGQEYINKYIDFLKCGGSKSPLDSLLVAGIDMRDPQVIQDAINDFALTIKQYNELCD